MMTDPCVHAVKVEHYNGQITAVNCHLFIEKLSKSKSAFSIWINFNFYFNDRDFFDRGDLVHVTLPTFEHILTLRYNL